MSLSSSTDYNDYIKNMAAGNVDAMYVKEGDKKTQLPKDVFSDYMFNTILKDHIQTLYKTQRIAAREAHFDHLYQNDRGRALNNSENYNAKYLEESGHPTAWSSMYLDTVKDLPTATDSDELTAQLHQIEMLNDRTPAARNYLAQKAQTRYWMQQVVQMGEGDQLMHFLYGRDWGITGSAADPYGMHEYTTRANGLFEEMMKDKDDPLGEIKAIEYENADEIPGFVAPWQNAGENLIPDLTGALDGQDVTDYMSDVQSDVR